MTEDKTYTQASTAWAKNVWDPAQDPNLVEQVTCSPGDVQFEWVMLGSPRRPCLMVRAFDDGWDLLASLMPLIDLLATDSSTESATPERLIELLKGMGYKPSEYHNQLMDRSVVRRRYFDFPRNHERRKA